MQSQREVTFGAGGIMILTGERAIDYVVQGVVLLTVEEARRALQHGWAIFGETVPDEDGFVRVKRGENITAWQLRR